MSASRTDFAMRGLAISFLTLARVISPITFLVFFLTGTYIKKPQAIEPSQPN
jgi:hypothetical protein